MKVEAPDNDTDKVYVDGVELDGTAYAAADIDHATLAAGCTLHFAMSNQPGQKNHTPENMPFSLSTEE